MQSAGLDFIGLLVPLLETEQKDLYNEINY